MPIDVINNRTCRMREGVYSQTNFEPDIPKDPCKNEEWRAKATALAPGNLMLASALVCQGVYKAEWFLAPGLLSQLLCFFLSFNPVSTASMAE